MRTFTVVTDVALDSCLGRNCGGHGDCYGTADDGWECLCEGNHYGPSCEYEGEDPCEVKANRCHGHGVCTHVVVNNQVRHNCTCDEGYEPLFNCELQISHSSQCIFAGFFYGCPNGGTCIGGNNTYTCDCPASESQGSIVCRQAVHGIML